MTALTQNLGHRRTARMRRPVAPTDTIVRIGALPPVPAPRPRHPGGDGVQTRRGVARAIRQFIARLTVLLAFIAVALVFGVVIGEYLASAAGIQQ